MGGFRLLAETENTGDYESMSKQVMREITQASSLGMMS